METIFVKDGEGKVVGLADNAHSLFSASAAPRWMACPGSVVLSQGLPDNTSIHAATGTVEHQMLEALINNTAPAIAGQVVKVDGFEITVDDDMIDRVCWAYAQVQELTHGADTVTAEARVNYAKWLGVPTEQAWGTRDVGAIFMLARELLVIDYKGGQQPVPADSEQLKLYAGVDLLTCDDLDIEIDTVRLVILQPKVSRVPLEHTIHAHELRAWLTSTARSAASSVRNSQEMDTGYEDWQGTYLTPGDKQCRWCKAKATCPALRAEVADSVNATDRAPASPDEFADMEVDTKLEHSTHKWLAACMAKADLIEDWLKAVRAEVERRLLAGSPIPGYKLVQGKQGNRAWADATAAEALLKSMRLKVEEMYDLKLISPTSAEKLQKTKAIGPRQWPKVEALITRAPGKPHVAPATDPRPALDVKPVVEEFADLSNDIC